MQPGLRNREERVRFAGLYYQHLCVRDHSAYMVGLGYGCRNTAVLAILAEIWLSAQPGGVYINLDFNLAGARAVENYFCGIVAPGRFAGCCGLIAMVYGYLAPSIRMYF